MLVKFVAKLHKPRMFCFAATLIADSHLHQHLINYWYWSLDFRYSITLEGGRDDPFFGVFIFFSIQVVNWRFLSRNFTELLFQSEIQRNRALFFTELCSKGLKSIELSRGFRRKFTGTKNEIHAFPLRYFCTVLCIQYLLAEGEVNIVERSPKTRLKRLFNNLHLA